MWNCVRHENMGRECIKDEFDNLIKCARGVDGYLHPSDHLAVFVEFKFGELEGLPNSNVGSL